MNHFFKLLLVSIFVFLNACHFENKPIKKEEKIVSVPNFNPDTAYNYIQEQVSFGSREPNSIAHKECSKFLITTLSKFADSVITQNTVVKRFDGKELKITNIIGQFSPKKNNRLLLCAHWDSRFIADNDSLNTDMPILGANDGGSGVGVLLEIARNIYLSNPELGVDIIFFDAEDQGEPLGSSSSPDSWCLGSQYWAKNPHTEDYFARYGILLDMVGGKNAMFTKEGTSMYFASNIVNKVWKTAGKLGFSSYFVYEETSQITDDHYYINIIRKIPTIDIIEHDFSTKTKFNKHWHTHADDMNNIDKNTLYAVGQTVLNVIYNEK